MSLIVSRLRQVIPTSIAKWFAIWTAVGALFSLQLRWHYDLPWSLSLFWGFTDWYIWSFLALAIFAGVRELKRSDWTFRNRLLVYVAGAPMIAALHVTLTMLVGSIDGLPSGVSWTAYFVALYIKKITLNALTFGVLVAVGENLNRQAQKPVRSPTSGLLAKRGATTRIISPGQIIWGEVSGNYVNLHTQEGVWPVRITLAQLLRDLPAGQFAKISRSRLICLGRVEEMRSGAGKLSVTLSNDTELDVARRHTATVRDAVRKHWRITAADR